MRHHARHELVELRVQEWLTSGQGHDQGAELRQVIDARVEHVLRDGLRNIVELVAVAAGQVAAPGHDELCQKRASDVEERSGSAP